MQLPLFEAILANEDDGIMKVSLVDNPATERNWVFYENDEKNRLVKFAVEDEYEHKILCVVMRANFPIYRYDPFRGEFYITYRPETIKKMAEKLMVDGYQNCINLMHEENTDVDGVNMIQMFIKDTEKGISPKGFEDVEDGSLFAEYHIENDAVWEAVKNGTFKSVSLEGFFTIEPTNKENKYKKMINKFKNMLKEFLEKFGAIEAEDGTVLNFDGEVLEVGTAVTDDEGNAVADGEYTYEGNVYTVAEGVVTEIKPVEDETTEETTEVEVEAEDEESDEAETTTETTEETTDEETTEEETTEDDVETLKKKIEDLMTEIDTLKKELEEIKKEPAADTVVEEFEKKTKSVIKNNKLAKAIAFAEALK